MSSSIHQQLSGKKVAFLSTFTKTGLESVAKALVESGYLLLSTGGTFKYLTEKGFEVKETSEITGFDELLGGRVKSLHPEIFAGILAERDKPDHQVPFTLDTVVVNLYPFEQERDTDAAKNDPNHLLHFIDIGGSALIRAAAKNYLSVNILCDPAQYAEFVTELQQGKGETSKIFRQRLAQTAFQRSIAYETAIGKYFDGLVAQQDGESNPEALPDQVTLSLQKIQDLRYGENPHQKAALYGLGHQTTDFELLHGKELSYNNILDMEAGWAIATEFVESPACAVIKHNNPCGVAISHKSIDDAYRTAFMADSLSAFGGIVAVNQPVNAVMAKEMKEVFLEVIIAPDFAPEAFETLSAKKNLRLVKRPLPEHTGQPKINYKHVSADLFLVQTETKPQETKIEQLLAENGLQTVTSNKPSQEQLQDMVFAWKVVKHVKSNAVVLVRDGKTVGIGGGQTSRIGALENAIKQACDEATDAVLASDGFLPHEDNIHAALQARVGAIIQPGGSIKDKDIIALADQHNLPIVTTGFREFRH
ncbi:MAG: bifunctional phosphoribosylaminoimidazolecarboxamide formyltransferase/IMP cyclohydrolase [Vampirovibrio sp.]|nr:bifunctional phosphoribosylaminoimidazolecarboxamide formyltransferase/IMP cyclohydrolase [Vampirovibrio sp.]